jgi:predicted dehydrogenase
MDSELTVALAGLGGYGSFYLSALLDDERAEGLKLVAGVEPSPDRCPRLDELRGRGVKVYDSLAALYAETACDLTILASPIHYHCPQTCLALERGSHVLCEKPLAATVQEADRMIAARDEAGRSVAIGYQWSYSPAVQALKRDIIAGVYGAPRRLKTMCLWPRTHGYYGRNTWAARVRHEDGRWILDSPVNNAVAHYLHNMLYLLGDTTDTSARPVEVRAELYRANDIENYDTGVVLCRTDRDAEVLFVCSHALTDERGPDFLFEFERGTVIFARSGGVLLGRPEGAPERDYGSPDAEPRNKLWNAVRAAQSGEPVLCGIEAARAHTLVVNGAQDSADRIVEFPRYLVRSSGEGGARVTWVTGLAEALTDCYDRFCLPSGLGAEWAVPPRVVGLTGYTAFPSR